MADRFAARVGPVLQPLLEPGEQLVGVVAATLKKTFSGGLYAIGVTDRRLVGGETQTQGVRALGERLGRNLPQG